MKICVRLFARARELARADAVDVELPEGATAGELRHLIAAQVPGLGPLLERSALAINDEFADDELTIPRGAEVALLPPVSGG
jgi:molybdopterin converting factor subunit 1